MSQSWSRLLLSLLATSVLFTSCKRNYSKDDTPTPVYAPSVIVGCDNQVVYAFNPADGSKNWELALPCPLKASPLLYGNFVYLANSLMDTLYKVNAKTGVVVKRIAYASGGAGGTVATPAADGNLIYYSGYGRYIVCSRYWSVYNKMELRDSRSYAVLPVIYNGNVYLATTTGSVYCLEKVNGNKIATAPPAPTWSLAVPGASFISSPAICGTSPATYMYLGSISDSNMYSLWVDIPETSAVGVVRWSYKTKGGIKSSPALYGGNCIFGSSDFRVYCVDTSLDPTTPGAPPEARWIDSNLHSEVVSSPFAADQTVYIGCKDYKLYALKIINGQSKWEFHTNGVITSSPLVYKGTVFIGSYDKNLYALDTARGTLKWSKNVNGQIDMTSPVIDDFSKTTGFNSQVSGFTN